MAIIGLTVVMLESCFHKFRSWRFRQRMRLKNKFLKEGRHQWWKIHGQPCGNWCRQSKIRVIKSNKDDSAGKTIHQHEAHELGDIVSLMMAVKIIRLIPEAEASPPVRKISLRATMTCAQKQLHYNSQQGFRLNFSFLWKRGGRVCLPSQIGRSEWDQIVSTLYVTFQQMKTTSNGKTL